MPRRRRKARPLRLGAALLVALALVAGWLGARGLQAKDELVAAEIDLRAARVALLDARPEEARAALDAAGRRTQRARSLTGDPVWRAASVLPLVGATPAAVRGLAAAADDLARAVLPAAEQAVTAADVRALRRPDGTVETGLLRAALPGLRDAAADAREVQADLGRLRSAGVLPFVEVRRQELLTQTEQLASVLTGAEQALDVAPLLLGEDRRRNYLVLVQQTGESRGTGGLIGGFVAVSADRGRLQVLSSGSNADLSAGRIEVPAGVPQEFVRLYGPSGAFLTWQNANLSADLPVVARVLAARWQAQGGVPLDGVVLLDGLALARLLEGSGPVELDGRTLAAADLPDYLAVGQYGDFAPAAGDAFLEGVSARKDQLGRLAALVAGRLVGGAGDTSAQLRGLSRAVQSGHLRFASDDPALGPALTRAGVDGALPGHDVPVAYPVVYNTTAGKLDHFLDRRVSYVGGACAGSRRRSTITVELRNDVPAGALPPYLTTRLTPQGRVDSRSSSVVLSVYATAGAELVRGTVDGGPVAPEAPDGPLLGSTREGGLPVFTVHLELPPGQTRSLRLELDEPELAGAPVMPEQPLSRALDRQVTWAGCR